MSSALDMSLDDLIKNNKKSGSGNSGGRGRGRGSGPGPARRVQNRAANRAAPYAAPKAPETTWGHDMYADQGFLGQAGQASAIETGTKLYISNLDYGVSNEDIKELFSEVGDLKRYSVHYDRSGRSKGTAEIVFSRRSDAVSAVKRYNNVQLDGKPMKIEIVGANITTPAAPAVIPYANGAFATPYGVPRGGQGRGGGGGGMGRSLGGRGGRGGGRSRPSRGGGGGGRGSRRGGEKEKVSADDLDADLDKYHTSAAMETS